MGGAVVAPGSASCRSRATGGRASAVGEPLGGAIEARRSASPEAGRPRWAARPLAPRGPAAHREGTQAWAAGFGLRNQPLDFVARGPLDGTGMWSEVSPFASLAHSSATGWSCQRPVGRALERDEEKIRRWKQRRWPEIKKKPAQKAAPSSSSTKAD